MPAPVYATAEQVLTLGGVTVPAGEEGDRALRRASREVTRLLKTAEYEVDAGGLPVDPDLQDLLAEATALQLAYWDETGDVTGAGAILSGGSIGSVSLPTVNAAAGTTGRASPEVAAMLRDSDLIRWRVKH